MNTLPLAEKFSEMLLVLGWPQHLLPPLQMCQRGLDVNSEMSWDKSPFPFYFRVFPAWVISEHQPRAAQGGGAGKCSSGPDLFCNTALV